jgi:starvation-inducible DNA-binding protein
MKATLSLEKNASKQIAHDLSIFLSDTYVLYVKTQNFHWNVVDPRFYSLHLFLEKQYEELAEAADIIAERIRALGEKSPGSLGSFLELTTLDEAGRDLSAEDMLQELLHDHEQMIRWIRPQIEQSQKLGDEGTADMLIQRLRAHEKASWMIRSQA